MAGTLQQFLATATPKAADALIEALERIPSDRRGWSPEGKSRSALNQVAECAILNGYTADLIESRQWPIASMEDYFREQAALAQDEARALDLLRQNTPRVVQTILAVPDEDLQAPIALPWETQSLAEVISYPYWNMSYHLGQVNYIASLLGCLK